MALETPKLRRVVSKKQLIPSEQAARPLPTLASLLALNSAVALAYFTLGKLGLALALPPGYSSAIWPAAGLAFAMALQFGGARVCLGIFLGSLLTNATPQWHWQWGPLAFEIAAGSTLQALVGAGCLRSYNPELLFDRPERVLRFTLVALLSTLVATTVGNASLLANGFITLHQLGQSFLTWWLGDALGVQIFVPLTLLVLGKTAAWRRRRVSVGLPLVLAFSLCGLVYFLVRGSEERQLVDRFANATEPCLMALDQIDRGHGQALRQLALTAQQGAALPGPEFAQAAQQVQEALPNFRAIEWVPALRAGGEWDAFVRQARVQGLAVPPLRRPSGFHARADGRIAPIVYVQPLATNELALGLDLLAEPVRASAFDRALNGQRLALTSPLRLAQDSDGPGGVLMMAPFHNARVQGVVLGVIDLRLIDRSLQSVPGTAWSLYEERAGGWQLVSSSSPQAMATFDGSSYVDRSGVYLQRALTVADQRWRLVLFRPITWFSGESGQVALAVLLLSFLVCAILASFTLLLSSDRERVGEEVARKTAALRAEIVERERMEADLLVAKDAAEAANLAKSRFLATMSHEIRTPMNGIMGMAQILLAREVAPLQRLNYAQIILNSGKTLLALLNDILDFSKIEADKLELEHIALAPSDLLREVQAVFGAIADEKGLQLRTELQLEPGSRYLGDPTRLRQMLSNLTANAIKFTSRGSVSVAVREVGAAGDATALLEFSVTDTGIGIPVEKQAQLFHPFTQADSSTTRQYGGTGLGLSIVHGLAVRMGGSLGVKSAPGAGAQFWIRIPLPRLGGVDAGANAMQPGALPPDVTAQRRLVLVAEDNAVNREVAEALLRSLGVQDVVCVDNGEQALRYVTSGAEIGLVLMDCQMPVRDGLEATEAIRVWERTQTRKRLPIVALTASAYDEDRRRCLHAGMDGFLTKPLDVLDLKAVLAQWL